MSHGETRRLQIAKLLCAFGGILSIPRKQCWKWKIESEYARGDDPSLRGECISGNKRAVPDIQIGQVSRRMTGRKDRLKRSHTIAIFEKKCRLGFSAGKANQSFP